MKEIQTIGVVGAGAMGRGIAQIAAQAGLRVRLYDTSAEVVASAREALRQTWDKLAQKGKLGAADAQAALERVVAAGALSGHGGLPVGGRGHRRAPGRQARPVRGAGRRGGRGLHPGFEHVLAVHHRHRCGLQRPQRVAGYHFFNPVALMKVVK